MAVGTRTLRTPKIALAMTLVLITTLAVAAGPRKKVLKPGQFNPDHETVEMFDAIDQDQLEVKLIPKDATECRVMIKNKTNRPLNVQLPAAFASVPVLAQPGIGGGGLGGGGQQAGGGGFGGGGFGGGGRGGGGGGGFFNVAPEKVAKFKLATVCLEHGKKDPRPAIPYEIKPIESFTDKTEVHELCRLLATGKIDQRAAQFAAWHLNNDMSFQELAAKVIRRANGVTRPYFSPQEIRGGVQVAAIASRLAEQRKQSAGETDELSRK